MLSRKLLVCVAVLLPAAAPVAARAAGADTSHALTRLLPHQKDRALCYASAGAPVTYALEDIPARAPPRTLAITRFVLQIASRQHDADDGVTPPAPGVRYYEYGMIAEVADPQGELISAGDCDSDRMDGFGCGPSCDGGSVALVPLSGTDGLMMRISEVVRRFRMSWGCGGGGSEDGRVEVLRYDPATPAIRLDRVDAATCAPIGRMLEQSR